jgi:Tfp pilus assembly protein PilF
MENPVKRFEDDPIADELSPEAVQNQVERILGSEKFARSKRLRSLLRFTVNQTLQGHADTLKEYVIGTEVLKKPETYDPRRDSLVRVLASRLRVKLKEYYNDGGSEDPLVIEFPKGKYVPRFQRREQLQTETEKKLRARNAYSYGRFLAARCDEASLADATQHLEEAVEADPNWAAAHIALASVYADQAFLGFRRPREAWPMARAQAEMALQLDEMSSEGHLVIGMVCALFEWRWHDADVHFQKAIERDTYSGAGHLWRAMAVLVPGGKMSEAQQELRRAHELAPAPLLDEATALALYFAEQYEEVLRLSEQPDGAQRLPWWLHWMRGCALLGMNRLTEAVELLQRLREQYPERVRIAATLGYAYGVAGEADKAHAIAAELRDRRTNGSWIPNYELALIDTGVGNRNEAMALIQDAVREKEPWVAYLNIDPRVAPLRGMPRFAALTRKVVLTEPEFQMQGAAL